MVYSFIFLISFLIIFVKSTTSPQQIINNPNPLNYSQKFPQIRVQTSQIVRSTYCPAGHYFTYQFNSQLNCFYYRRVIGDYPSTKICFQNNLNKLQYAQTFQYNTNGSLFIVGTNLGNIYVWKVQKCEINNFKYAYSYHANNSFNGIWHLSVSKYDQIAIGISTKLQIFSIIQNDTILKPQKDYDFKNGTNQARVYALAWHGVDQNVIFIGTQGSTDLQGFWMYNSSNGEIIKISNKKTNSILTFKNQYNVLKSSYQQSSQGYIINQTVDQFYYSQGNLIFNRTIFNKRNAQKIQFSADNYFLWVDNSLVQQKIAIYQVTFGVFLDIFYDVIFEIKGYFEFSCFSPDGSQFLLVNNSDYGVFHRYSLCEDGEYYHNLKCLQCAVECFSCVNQNLCTSCIPSTYFYNDTCLKCSSKIRKCSACRNEEGLIVCSECIQGYTLNGNKTDCQCIEQFQVNQNGICVQKKSQENNNQLIFIIGGAIGLLIVAGIATGCICKKRNKNKLKQKVQKLTFSQKQNFLNNSLLSDSQSIISEQSIINQRQKQSLKNKYNQGQRQFYFQQQDFDKYDSHKKEQRINDAMMARIGKDEIKDASVIKRNKKENIEKESNVYPNREEDVRINDKNKKQRDSRIGINQKLKIKQFQHQSISESRRHNLKDQRQNNYVVTQQSKHNKSNMNKKKSQKYRNKNNQKDFNILPNFNEDQIQTETDKK